MNCFYFAWTFNESFGCVFCCWIFSSRASGWKCSPSNILIVALWDLKKEIQLSHIWNPDSQKLWNNKCVLFKLLIHLTLTYSIDHFCECSTIPYVRQPNFIRHLSVPRIGICKLKRIYWNVMDFTSTFGKILILQISLKNNSLEI